VLKALIRVQLLSLASRLFPQARKQGRSALRKLGILVLALYVIGSVGFSVGALFGTLWSPYQSLGLQWLYHAMAALAAFGLSFISSVFLTQSALYNAKDNELLLSLPIRPGFILLSRLLLMWGFVFLTQQVILLPSAAVWWLKGPVRPAGVFMYLLTSLLLPLPAVALSSLGGWLLALAAGRVKRKSLVVTLLSVAFLALYFYAFSRLQAVMGRLAAAGESLAAAVRGTFFPAYHLGFAVAEGSGLSLLLFALCALAPAALAFALLSRRYLAVLTSRRGTRRADTPRVPEKARSPRGALLIKELRRFVSAPEYMLNSGFGLLFIPALPVVMMLDAGTRAALLSALPAGDGLLGAAAAGVLCLMAGMVTITAPSVSLEGKSLWILRTLPVEPMDVLIMKAAMHLLVSLPFILLGAVLAAVAMRLPAWDAALAFVLPALLCALTALLGLAFNLRFPRLDWQSLMQPIKQGLSVVLTMAASFLAVALPAAAYYFLLKDLVSPRVFLLLTALVYAGLSAMVFRHLKKSARDAFLTLGG